MAEHMIRSCLEHAGEFDVIVSRDAHPRVCPTRRLDHGGMSVRILNLLLWSGGTDRMISKQRAATPDRNPNAKKTESGRTEGAPAGWPAWT